MKYWAFLNHQLIGPYDPGTLRQLPEFSPKMKICREGDDVWQEASLFPEITAPPGKRSIALSGDYLHENRKITLTQSSSEPLKNVAPAPALKTQTGTATPAADAPKPPAAPVKSKRNQPFRSASAMVSLWAVFFGLYIPQSEQVDWIIDGLVAQAYSSPMVLKIHAWNPGGKAKRKPHSFSLATVFTSTASFGHEHIANSYKDLKKTETITEEDSTDLGNGMEMKTITTVDEVNGQKTWKTHRYLRSHPGAHFEPM